jgi:hypothetical protein
MKHLRPKVGVVTSFSVLVQLVAAAMQEMPAEGIQRRRVDVGQPLAPALNKPPEVGGGTHVAACHQRRISLLLKCFCEAVDVWSGGT